MEDSLVNISNKLSFKEIQSYEVSGVVNDNGQLISTLNMPANFKEDATHYIYLVGFEAGSYIPNINKNVNDKFFYIDEQGNEKVITFPPGGYDISDIATIVKDKNANIDIKLNESTVQCEITLSNGVKIDFTKDKTFHKLLSFDKEILAGNKKHTSKTVVNILTTQKIYISCDICVGSLLNGQSSNVLYSFPNELHYGYLITQRPMIPREKQLMRKQFHQIIFRFFNENNEPINFMKEKVTLEIIIKQA